MLHCSLAALMLAAHTLHVHRFRLESLLNFTERGEPIDLYQRLAWRVGNEVHLDIESRMLDAIRGRPIGLNTELGLPYTATGRVPSEIIYVTPKGRIEFPNPWRKPWPDYPREARFTFGTDFGKTEEMLGVLLRELTR